MTEGDKNDFGPDLCILNNESESIHINLLETPLKDSFNTSDKSSLNNGGLIVSKMKEIDNDDEKIISSNVKLSTIKEMKNYTESVLNKDCENNISESNDYSDIEPDLSLFAKHSHEKLNSEEPHSENKSHTDNHKQINEDSDIGPDFSLFIENKKTEETVVTNEVSMKRTATEAGVGPDLGVFIQSKHCNKSECPNKESNETEDNVHDDQIGPSIDLISNISNEPPRKKLKVKGCEFASVHLDCLPKAKYYQRSYMHRTPITNIQFSKTGYLLTSSIDGVIKFWKKSKNTGLDFVKRFRAHLDSVLDMKMNQNGEYCASIGADKTIKIFDILNCDMINMIKLEFLPYCCCWIYSETDSSKYLAVAEAETGNVYVINAFEKNLVMKKLDRLHEKAVNIIIYNARYDVVVSLDSEGLIEYWTGESGNYEFPQHPRHQLKFEFKTDTDLYCLLTAETVPITASFSPDGRLFVVYSTDRKVRLFDFRRGKLLRVIDEEIQTYTDTDKAKDIASMELGRRLAVEKELDRSEFKFNIKIEFDVSSNFLLLPSLMGVRVVDVRSLEATRMLGVQESIRFLGVAVSPVAARQVADPALLACGLVDHPDTQEERESRMPLIVCTGYKRNRLYVFTNDEPLQSLDADGNTEIDRDVLNEKPTKEEMLASGDSRLPGNRVAGGSGIVSNDMDSGSGGNTRSKLPSQACLHTSFGDIQLDLYPLLTPRTVENFVGHGKSGYYNGRIFHRIIKNFMIQTGCPLGNGSGGASIWGGEFEDEFHSSLHQDQAFLLCMANTGERHTNGSQFFITVKPCPWLENKHTIFGRVTRGMEIVQKISAASTDKNDKPNEDISIMSVSFRHNTASV